MKKTILVLANSIKKSERCVAGIEVAILENNKIRNEKKWIRPISNRGEGELKLSEIYMSNKSSYPSLLDIVEVPLLKKAHQDYHPEDWVIDPSEKWIHKGALKRRSVESFLETPQNLWLEKFKKNDRTSQDFQKRQSSSLYLVKVEKFEIHIVKGFNEQKRVRAKFVYNDDEYNLSITDPDVSKKYYPDFKNVNFGRVENGPSNSPVLCISITPPFSGSHYKVVASIIE